MRDWLSPCQREQFDEPGYFDVVGCMTGRKYRIYHNVLPPNVFEIDDAGRRKMGLCFAPVGPLVKGDVMLAQKIALETDEQSALAAANKIRLTRARHFFLTARLPGCHSVSNPATVCVAIS